MLAQILKFLKENPAQILNNSKIGLKIFKILRCADTEGDLRRYEGDVRRAEEGRRWVEEDPHRAG